MSAFFGEFRHDAQAVAPASLVHMAEALPWHGGDDRGMWHLGGLGLGGLKDFSTLESRFEPALLVETENQRLLAGNFRIDNRTELIEQLHVTPAPDSPVTDADLILAAHAVWGEACPKHLLGDFAFALWDQANGCLLIVRDQIGIAPLFYFPIPGGLIFASDLRALAAHSEGPRELDPVAVVHHLRDAQYVLPHTTYLAGVRRLPPGHLLRVTATGYGEQRYWSPDQVPKLSLPNADAYAQRLRELFQQAVACRLRTLHPVGAHLSGGLDSTSIALEAQRQLTVRGEGLAGVYTWLPELRPQDHPEAPEYGAARRAEAALGMRAEAVDLTPEALRLELARDIALEGFTNLWYESLVRRKAQGRSIRTLLSGWGGDEVVSSGSNGYAAELFWRGRWIRLARLIAARAKQLTEALGTGRPWRRALGLLYRQVLLPSLPATLFQRWPGTRLGPLPGFDPRDPACIALQGQLSPPWQIQRPIGKRAEMIRALTAGHLQDRIETWAAQGAQDGIQYAYPLLDRRLIEFCLGAPPELFVHPSHSRGLFRAAMDGLLPENIRLASVKLEVMRVSRLVETLQAALFHGPAGQSEAPDLGQCLAQTRRLQVEAMRAAAQKRRTTSKGI